MRKLRLAIAPTLLLAFVAAPVTAKAQGPADRTAIGQAALTSWAHSLRSKACAYCSAELIFEPLVLRGWWGNGVRADATTPRVRDSIEIGNLTEALHGVSATKELRDACTGAAPRPSCPVSSRTGRAVAISDPRVVGDTATLLLRDAPPNLLGNDRSVGGAQLLVSMIREVRVNGKWTVQCIEPAASDFRGRVDQVEAKCAASAREKGG